MRTKRRGIGNVIAAAVMVFLVIFTVSQLYVYNLDKLDDYNRVAADMFSKLSQKQNDRISISNVQLDVTTGPNIKATLTLSNTGGITTHIVAIWFDNADVSLNQHVRCVKGSCSWPAGTDIYAGQGLSVVTPTLDTGISITPPNPKIVVKVVSELGNSASVTLLPPSQEGTTAQTLATTQLTLVPSNPITGNYLTVVLTVSNTNQLGLAFTSLVPDICIAQGTLAPVAATCHNTDSGSPSTPPASPFTTLTDSTKNWTPNRWAGYSVQITTGTGAGQTKTIVSNTATVLTVNSAWSPNLDSTSHYVIVAVGSPLPCDLTSTPVTCNLTQAVNPTSVSFLPYGASATFQWTYLVNAVTPDAPVTFIASYVALSSTGLQASQAPSQTATIRQVGGGSSGGGQGLNNLIGSLTIDITSFQYAKNVAGVCWKTGFQPKGGDTTVFRVRMTNIGSTTITLNQNSEFVDLQAASGGGGQLQPQEWFIATGATVVGGNIAPIALPGGGGVALAPGQIVAVYFGSNTQNSANAPSLPSSGNRLFTFMILLGTQTGAVPNYGQSIPFVGLSMASSDPAGCFSGPYP